MSNPGVSLGAPEPHHWIRPEEEKQLAVMIQKETSGKRMPKNCTKIPVEKQTPLSPTRIRFGLSF